MPRAGWSLWARLTGAGGVVPPARSSAAKVAARLAAGPRIASRARGSPGRSGGRDLGQPAGGQYEPAAAPRAGEQGPLRARRSALHDLEWFGVVRADDEVHAQNGRTRRGAATGTCAAGPGGRSTVPRVGGERGGGGSSVLDELAAAAAAAVRRAARRHLADVTHDGGDVPAARADYAAATDTWAALIQRAVTSEGIPDIARAAGCTRTTIYARTRDTPGTSGT